MSLIQLRNISFAHHEQALLDNVSLTIEPGQRVCIVGRNGEGKSTLLRIIEGTLSPDEGDIVRSKGLRIAALPQVVPQDLKGTAIEIAAEGLGPDGAQIARAESLQRLLASPELDANERDTLRQEYAQLHTVIERENKGHLRSEVAHALDSLGIDPSHDVATFSAGMKRRVLLARAIVSHPNLLLLDEPTNHLDIPSIDTLEAFFEKYRGTVVFVTHDRVFLRKLATRIVDLDRGVLRAYDADYATYRKRKEAELDAETEQNAQFDKKLAQEEVWIRQGILARRTRNEGRVRALKQLREERKQRRERIDTARITVQEATASGRRVIRAKNVAFAFGDKPLVKEFTTLISRGDKIGLIGPNGVGKTTLLRLLLGELTPNEGEIEHGVRLEASYFDQLHAQLDLEGTVIDNVADGSDHVMVSGKKKHIYGYLQDFLFSPERARSPVKFLSGGERNRLLLARLFSKPANILVLDEPTNDLDTETLELLEQLLIEFSGTILMVSHDREFLNNVVTDTFAFEGNGVVKRYAGGYDDWLDAQRRKAPGASEAPKAQKAKPAETKKATQKSPSADSSKKRLTYGERLELEALPEKIEALEEKRAELHDRMAEPGFYQSDRELIVEVTAELEKVDAELAEVYERWECLEELAE